MQERDPGSKYKSGRSHLEMLSDGMKLDEIFEKGRGVVSRTPVGRGHLDAQIVHRRQWDTRQCGYRCRWVTDLRKNS